MQYAKARSAQPASFAERSGNLTVLCSAIIRIVSNSADIRIID